MKLPLPTTVSTVLPSASLITVKSTGTIVRASARSLPTLTAGTGATTAVLTAASPIGATVLQNARPVMPTTAGTERRFRCRPMPTVRPTTPTAPPNVPPGAVTQVITNPEIHAYTAHRQRRLVKVTVTVQPERHPSLFGHVTK